MIAIRHVPGSHYTETYVTDRLNSPATGDDVRQVVAAALSAGASEVLRVTVHGEASIDAAEAHDAGWLVATNQHSPARHGSSIEVSAIAPGAAGAARVSRPAPGAVLVITDEAAGEVRRLIQTVTNPVGSGVLDEALAGLERVEATLATAGMSPDHLDRTWYYVAGIATTYGELNKARDELFDRWDLTAYPASTGIGARLLGQSQVAIVAEATSVAGRAAATGYDTTMQCPPIQYGPRFARANRAYRNGCEVVNISGISSIDSRGESICDPDAGELVRYTMASLTDLLHRGGMAVTDVCSSAVYCKDADVFAAYQEWQQRNGVRLPGTLNCVDVCRPELRFEIEARALRPSHHERGALDQYG